eukprot:s184_g25.t1
MWELLKSQYVPKPFGSYYTAGQALKLLQDKALVNGPKVFSTDPNVDTWLFKTRTDRFLSIMQDACYVVPKGPDGTIAAGDTPTIEKLFEWLDFESRCMGMAMRYHNATSPDLNDMIIAQTILEDVTNYSNNKGKFRCAAQNHLMGMFTLARALERFVVGYQRMSLIWEVNALPVRINGIYQRFDIPDDLYKATGFNVINAEVGYYADVKMRYEAFQVFNDTLLKRTDTQGGTSGAALHRFEDWGVPLLPNDGRDPPDIIPDAEGKITLPFWSKDVYIPVPAQPKTSGDGEGTHSSMKVDPKPEPKVEAKKMPTPPSTPRGTAKSASAKKPTPPSEPPEWVNPVLPTGIDRKLEKGKDYKNLDFKAFLLLCGTIQAASMSDGPHATNIATSGWRQYLRRFVFYASTVFGITTEGTLKTTMLNATDDEWLKLYHYIMGNTSLPVSQCFALVESMLVMLGKVKDDEAHRSNSRLLLKTIRNNLGCKFSENVLATFRVDKIGGLVRSEPTIMLVDFDYRTKSTSGNTDNIESGLQSLGFAQLSVFQPDRELVTEPNTFLQIARNLRHRLKTNTALGSKTTVHVWFSFAAVMKFNPAQHDAKLNVPDGFFNKFTDILVEIQKDVARPILVRLLPDGEFHGLSTDLRKVASTFD